MNKKYIIPLQHVHHIASAYPIALSGDTGDGHIGGGNDDTDGDGSPDTKERGFEGYGNLW